MGSFLCFWAVWWICNALLWLIYRNDVLNWELWWWLDSALQWKGFSSNDGWGGLFENHRCGWHFHYLRWFTWVYVVLTILIGFWTFEMPILIICFLPSHSRSHKWRLSELRGLMWWGSGSEKQKKGRSNNRHLEALEVACWNNLEELRCLFVREGWSEYFLGLWRHPCSRMHLEDTHRWDWACLNIIHSEWESLSRVMWWG